MVAGYGVSCDEEFSFVEPRSENPYTFLAVSDFIKDRGNCMDVVKAFVQLDLPDARLIIKTNRGPWKNVNVTKGGKKFDVQIITEQYSQFELAQLMGRIDCLVYPSSGEASGLVALQAMSVGRPVIATDWGALGELVAAKLCLPVGIKGLVGAASFNRHHEGEGKWAEIDLESLCQQMAWVYYNREAAAELGRDASCYVKANYSWSTVATRAKEALQRNFGGL